MAESLLEMIIGAGMAMLLLCVGFYLTWKLRAVQLRRFLSSFHGICERKRGGVSTFSAICTNLGATVGIGNVLGVASGLSVGGPGSLLWMLIAAFFGMAIRYAENYLGTVFRKQEDGVAFGGPFFYMERFVPRTGRLFGRCFAAICLLGSLFGMGAALQARSIREVWSDQFANDPSLLFLLSAALLVFLAPVLLGGSRRIAKASEQIVPFMTLGYIICCVWILFRYRTVLPSVLLEIVRSGLSFRASAGASVGLFLRQTVLTGIRRGLFSNEAGTGLGAIAAASAGETDPETAGDSGILVTFLDTFVICLLTGLCLLVTQQNEPYAAWRCGIPWAGEAAPLLLKIFLTLFALTSIFGSGFYAESCLRYLSGGQELLRTYQIVCLFCVGIGMILPLELLWRSADFLNAALVIPNLTALFFAAKRNRFL